MKKSLLTLLAILVSIVFFGACLNVGATKNWECGDNLTCTLYEDGTFVIEGTGNMFIGWSYVSKTPWYYYRTSIKNVIIKDGTTSIGKYAFNECTSLESVIIPNSVTSIGDGAFDECTSLKRIKIPNSVTSIGDSAFSGCSSLKSIKIPDSVTSIDDNAFSFCDSLASVEIPDSITSISDYAFYGCTSLENIEIPDGVKIIGYYAFGECTNLKSIIIPNSVTSIGDGAFDECTSLKRIKIPNSVTSIGHGAFDECTSLESVEIPDSVTSIGNDTFYSCTRLARIEIPDSVTSIGHGAFYECSSLESVEIPDGVTSIGDSAFSGCSSLKSIKIPDSVTSIGDSAFSGCSSLKSIKIPDSVTSIDDNAFYFCDSLASVEIPDGVTSIGDGAFKECSSLESIKIPDGVTSIGSDAFYGCTSLESVEIPDSVTSIGDYAFSFCDNLKKITIYSKDVTFIKVFLACSKLTIYGYAGSTSETYAKENGIPFKLIQENTIQINGKQTISINKETIFTAICKDENGNTVTGNIKWSLSNNSIVQQVANGNALTLKGLKAGKTTVTATHSSGASASIEITVNDYTVELEEGYFEFLDEEKETIYSYKVKNGDSIALASETKVALEIVNKAGTAVARIKNHNDYSGTFEIEGLSIGECELVAKINGVEMDRAPINILGNIADTINNETVLRAKVLLKNYRYKYYRDTDSIHHVHIKGIGLGASVFYQNAGNSLNLLFKSITEGKSTNDINASQAYKVVLLKLLYGGNKLDEYMDYANKIDTYFLKYGSMIENKTPILGVNNVKDLKTQFSNLLKGSTIDLGILDSVLVVGKSMRECISEMKRIYMLASCSDSQVKALKLIAANTSDKNLKQACNELATEIIIATDTKLIQAAGTGFVAGCNTLVEETACSVVQGALNFIPGVTVWNISLDATKLGLNALFKIDDSAEDLINLSALHSIENSLYNAMLNAESAFSANMTADNALNFMATADFYKEILLYGNEIIRSMVVHNAEAKVASNANRLVLKSLFDSEKDLVETVNNFFEKEGITHQLECIDQLKKLLENADFYDTYGVDIVEFIREVKSTTISNWAKPEVQKAIDLYILPDYMQNNYQNNITRAELCTLLTFFIQAVKDDFTFECIENLIKEKGAQIKSPFDDTFYEYVDYIYKLGIASGMGDGKFEPLGEITREQAATMLMRTATVLDYNTSAKDSGFSDISTWAKEGVNFVYQNGIMSGTGNGFEPKGKYTKEQAVVTLVRLYNFLKQPSTETKSENNSDKKEVYDEDKAKQELIEYEEKTFKPTMTALPKVISVGVNGTSKKITGYNIGGNNFFKLRDIAALLNGTGKQFSIEWLPNENTISCTTNKEYETVGGELNLFIKNENKTANKSNPRILIDGKEVELLSYNIGGNNYIKLRDVAEAFDFSATWDYETSSNVINTNERYIPGK